MKSTIYQHHLRASASFSYLRERQVAQFIQDHQIDVHQPVCQLPGLVGVSSFSVQ